jgi:hypothetical protein
VSGRIVELAGLMRRKRSFTVSLSSYACGSLSSRTVWKYDIWLLDVTEKGRGQSIPATTTSDGILGA